MKNCPRCNSNLDDNAMYCTACGLQFAPPQEQPAQNTYTQQEPAPGYPVPAAVNQYDHTAEFSAEEVADNKLYAMLIYLTSILGIIVAVLIQKNKNSAYLEFHIKENIKLLIIETLIALATGLLSWTCIASIAGGVCLVIAIVVQLIGFFKTAGNKSIEVPIIRSFGFLK